MTATAGASTTLVRRRVMLQDPWVAEGVLSSDALRRLRLHHLADLGFGVLVEGNQRGETRGSLLLFAKPNVTGSYLYPAVRAFHEKSTPWMTLMSANNPRLAHYF